MQKTVRDVVRGAAILTVGQGIGYGLSFVRNLILARLLTKADFGLAAALSLSLSVLELVARMAFGRQIIQAPDGDRPDYQAVAHSVQSVAGLASCLLVIAAAWPMAVAFDQPELTWAFASVAIVPLARGFMHLDIARLQRGLAYGPQVMTEVVPQVFATVAAWPLAVWLNDFRAVLWIMLGKELLTVALSHLLARRSYRWAWRREYVKGMWTFGWPLLLNGLVMFVARQADQVVVGTTLSLEDLAVYSIAFTLTLLPREVFAQVAGCLMLPLLSRHQDDPVRFEGHYLRCLEISVVAALVLVGPLLVAGDVLVRILCGPKYADMGMLMTVFGAVIALSFFRWAQTVAAMSRADTLNQLYGNVARSVSLPLVLLAIALGTRDLTIMAACGLGGEAVSIWVTLRRLNRRLNIGWRPHAKPLAFLVGSVAFGTALHTGLAGRYPLWGSVVGVLALLAGGALTARLLFPELILTPVRTSTPAAMASAPSEH